LTEAPPAISAEAKKCRSECALPSSSAAFAAGAHDVADRHRPAGRPRLQRSDPTDLDPLPLDPDRSPEEFDVADTAHLEATRQSARWKRLSVDIDRDTISL
jgi:hypothetical protein